VVCSILSARNRRSRSFKAARKVRIPSPPSLVRNVIVNVAILSSVAETWQLPPSVHRHSATSCSLPPLCRGSPPPPAIWNERSTRCKSSYYRRTQHWDQRPSVPSDWNICCTSGWKDRRTLRQDRAAKGAEKKAGCRERALGGDGAVHAATQCRHVGSETRPSMSQRNSSYEPLRDDCNSPHTQWSGGLNRVVI
jgi:hypothetical protein